MNEQPVFIPIDLIDPNPYQPREAMDPEAVASLAADIKRDGLNQIPTARRCGDRYQLAFGHRRHAAIRLLHEQYGDGFAKMPLIIRDLDDLQMFERGVSENVQRADLNRIEIARAMRRYMDDFKKTSQEAADFFGVSAEQVRATVRLLDLPPVAQEQLAAGTINVEAARTILSIQRIATADEVARTVQLMAKGVDPHGNPATAGEIARYTLGRLDETVRMWSDNRDGKPRSTEDYGNEGWLLSMKNFPNKFLPELTPVDLAIALGIQDDPQMIAAANTWAMYRRGETEELTQDVLDQIPPEIREKVDHLLNPPACSACPFYTRVDGIHYCGMKTCHTRKMRAWHYAVYDAAIRDLKIQPYDKADGAYRVINSYGNDEKLFENRNKDLRLIQRDQVKGYHYQHLAGVKDEAFLVVLVGETLKKEKETKREERQETKQAEDYAVVRERLIDQNRQRLEWETALVVQTLFDGLTDQALDTLWEAAFDWQTDLDDIPEDIRPEAIDYPVQRGLMALAMIREANTTADRNLAKMAKYAERLAEIVKPWKVRLPKKIANLAERMDQEIAQAVADLKKASKNGKANGRAK